MTVTRVANVAVDSRRPRPAEIFFSYFKSSVPSRCGRLSFNNRPHEPSILPSMNSVLRDEGIHELADPKVCTESMSTHHATSVVGGIPRRACCPHESWLRNQTARGTPETIFLPHFSRQTDKWIDGTLERHMLLDGESFAHHSTCVLSAPATNFTLRAKMDNTRHPYLRCTTYEVSPACSRELHVQFITVLLQHGQQIVSS